MRGRSCVEERTRRRRARCWERRRGREAWTIRSCEPPCLNLARAAKGPGESPEAHFSRRAFSKAGDSATQPGIVGELGERTASPQKERKTGRWSEKEDRGPWWETVRLEIWK